MSGTKTFEVVAVDPELERLAAARRAALERQRQELEREYALAEATHWEAEERLRSSATARAALEAKHGALERSLEEVTLQGRQLSRRLDTMRKETSQAREQAGKLSKRAEEERRGVESQLAELKEYEAKLRRGLAEANSAIAAHDGSEARHAEEAITRGREALSQVATQLAATQAQLAAFASSTRAGTVVDRLIESAQARGFIVSRVVSNAGEVEFHVTNAQQETLRIAKRVSEERLAAAVQDQRLQFLITGSSRDQVDACRLTFAQLLDDLDRQGIVTVSEISEEGVTRHSVDEPTTTATMERDRA